MTVDSVLMFTTLGSSCLEIWVNALESCFASGIVSGVASDDFCSFPFTPDETTVPTRMPTDSVAKIVRVYGQRLALKRTQKALARESIAFLLKISALPHYTFAQTVS